MQFEDGEETKSDFLARMILEGRIDYDAEKKTLKSNTTCQEEEPELCLQKKALKAITNPIIGCQETADSCAKYNVIAKGFFSSYTQKVEPDLLDGAKDLIVEAGKCCEAEVNLKPDGDSVKNEANIMMDEYHHKYDVNFHVTATDDPKAFLSTFFEANIKQLGEAAIRIAYVETSLEK